MNAEALHDYMNAVAPKRFALGHFDCVRFVAECLLVGWDKNYLEHLGYFDRRSAVHRLRHDGDLKTACDRVLGKRIPWYELEPGDIAYYDDPHATIGLVMDGYVAIKMGRQIYRGNVDRAEFGWRP